jgi:hypothetical protein
LPILAKAATTADRSVISHSRNVEPVAAATWAPRAESTSRP